MALLKKLKDGLSNTTKGLMSGFDSIFSGEFDDEFYEELEEILIMADVGMTTALQIVELLKAKIKQEKVKTKDGGILALRDIIADMMRPETEIDLSGKPSVILVIGVNGVGKTTSIGKIAYKLKNQNKKVLLVAADTFRAAAVEQLEIWGERCGCKVIRHAQGSDPSAVIFDGITSAKARDIDVVMCDTAGRLHNKKNLMAELDKICRIVQREASESSIETLLVVDATTGQNAFNQARLFKETANITGIILTKLDGSAKGGVVIGINNEVKIPVRYIGLGEGIDDIEEFDEVQFASALLGLEE